MIQRISILFMMIFCALVLSAQKIVKVEAEYTYGASEDMTLKQIKSEAIQRAKIQAMADKFGTMVSQYNATRIENINGDSQIDFLSLGGSEVQGEWIETLEEEVSEPVFQDNMVFMTARVVGRAREIVSAGVEFSTKILRNGVEDKFEDADFVEKDDMYLSFCASTSGYLSVYLIDSDRQAYCLLPYARQTEGIYKVEADRKYTFFKPSLELDLPPSVVDEYHLTTSKQSEQNLICVIFSPNLFTKAIDGKVHEKLPRSLSYEDFQKWLAKCRKKDSSMRIQQHQITIRKK